MLSDKKVAKVKNPVGKKYYTDRQKLEAVTTYLMLGGNAALTAKTLSISVETIYLWARSEWWNRLTNEIKKEEKLQLSARLKKIINTSWDVVGDRLEKGDWVLNNKTGEVIRKPVSLRDASKVAVDAAVLRDRLDLGDSFSTQTDAIEDKLTKLALAFTNLAKGITNNQAVEDIAHTDNAEAEEGTDDAVYDEWEEGHGEGESPLQQPSSPAQA
jgi:transposase-like protein